MRLAAQVIETSKPSQTHSGQVSTPMRLAAQVIETLAPIAPKNTSKYTDAVSRAGSSHSPKIKYP